jgi:hypothetical protein
MSLKISNYTIGNRTRDLPASSAVHMDKETTFIFLIYIQQAATLHSLFYLETALHVSGRNSTHHQERKQLSTASGICHTASGR